MKKLDQLTFTRFIAAFSVLLFHGGTQVFPFSVFPIEPLLTSGQTAVSYFYVLSGFVMALVYYRPEKRFNFRSYWTARFSRIYPVYILAFVLTCVYYIDIMSRAKWGKILANVFLYQAWIPTYSQSYNMAAWSLSVEAFFYVLFPVLAIALRRWPVRRVIGLSIGFWVVSNVLHSILYVRMMPEAHLLLDYFPLFHLNAFVLGMAGGVWYLAEAPRLEAKPARTWSLLLVALALISVALIGRKLLPALYRGLTLDVGLLAPLFLIVVLTLALDRSRLSAWMSRPGAVLLGDASYALYILHVPVRWLTERALSLMGINVAFPVMYAVYMPLMILLSVAVFVFIERPARDWLREHMDRLALILLDLALVAGAVWASFALRLGGRAEDFSRSELFTFRSALVLYFLALVLCGVYRSRKPTWGALITATALGSGGLVALSYLGWTSGWVEGFLRSVLLLQAGLTFAFLLASRFALRLWRPGARMAEEQA